ncbi:MAG: ligase-associated DNA damage response DEXH box helicase [Cytophagaceae bacterium]
MKKQKQKAFKAEDWFSEKGLQPFPFQVETWKAVQSGYSGLLNAPTGAGKTFAMWFGMLEEMINNPSKGLKLIWITPLRALAREIHKALGTVCNDINADITIGFRTGDTTAKEREKQKKAVPDVLITTPESLHIMFSQKGYDKVFKNLRYFVADEWHELMGSKRGVLTELALSRLKSLNPDVCVWGISATIGNLTEARQILLGSSDKRSKTIKAKLEKKIEVETLIPEEIDKYPWAGHLGIKMLPYVLDVIYKNNSTLIFTNTRSQAEIWYQRIITEDPSLSGAIAMHHGSVSQNIRNWVEDALHTEKLKAVICTSSLDLGVDFRPVDAVIQIGSAKGIARFVQRAGRSGHHPGATSKIFFIPTNSLEILEGAALRQAVKEMAIEPRIPYVRSFDVLIQYLVTLAVSDGFRPAEIFDEIKSTHCFSSITMDEWNWVLTFITRGGESLNSYDEFHKVVVDNGIYKVENRRIAMRHRLSIGTIVSDTMMQVKMLSGKRLGAIEEWFISSLSPGDTFWFVGKNLEMVKVKDMDVYVRNSKSGKGRIPSWQGGRMPLSSQLSDMIRAKLQEFLDGDIHEKEMMAIKPLLELQHAVSSLPAANEFLIEKTESKEGFHLFFFPFEGRMVHEGMAAVLSSRIGKHQPVSFSIAMNDYGFELLSDTEIDIESEVGSRLFDMENLGSEAMNCINATEMAVRKFRDIASIAGLVFQGYPGKMIKSRHLQASSHLFFRVFSEYEPGNLLLRQAYDEVADFQLSIARLIKTFKRINSQKIIINNTEKFSPLCFPIMAERFREKYSNEDLETRIKKLKAQLKLEA